MATTTEHTKLIFAKWSILALLLIYVSPFLSGWMNGYVTFLSTAGRHLTVFVSYLIFLWLGEWILNKMLGLE